MSNTQLTSAIGFNTNNIIFSDPIDGSIPDTPVKFKRIQISTKNPDGTFGELVLPTVGSLYSYGVSENLDQGTGKVNGYTFPICLYSKDMPTPEQEKWVESFNSIVEACKKHVLDNRDEIEKYDLEESDLKKFNPLYWKKEKGKVVDGTGPTLYAKLIMNKKLGKILSMFTDTNGVDIDPMELIDKRNNCRAAIKIESIFIGNKVSFQCKLYEAEVTLIESGMRRLLSRVGANTRVLHTKPNTSSVEDMLVADDEEDEDEDTGSIVMSEDEDEEKPPTPKKKKVKKVKKVKKKN